MHASFHFINQILQLAYTTQACIFNLKLMQCKQAYEYAHIKCKQSSSWACSPYLCASLVQELLILLKSSILFPLCPCPTSTSPHDAFTYLCSNFSPFVINFHKRCASYWCKGLHWGRWLTLESCIFMDITTNVGMPPLLSLEITHVGSLTLIPIGGAPPYVISWVIHLINLSSCNWGNFLHLMIT